MNQQRITPQVAADDFNHAIAVGDWIRYRSIKGEGDGTLFKTKTRAQVLQGHTAVVWLEGKSWCVCCDHCDKATPEDVQTIADMIDAGAFVKTAPPTPPTKPQPCPVHLTAELLKEAAEAWRTVQGDTGPDVHRPSYWIALANYVNERSQAMAAEAEGETAKPPAATFSHQALASMLEARKAELREGLKRTQPESVVASCYRQIDACDTLHQQLAQ